MHRTSLTVILLSIGSLGCDPPLVGDDAGTLVDGSALDALDAPPDAPRDVSLDAPLDGGPLANGLACSDAAACASGACVDGVCCDRACDGVCEACVATLTDQRDGACAPVRADDPEAECDASGCQTGECRATGCALQPSTFVCRDAAGACDVAESCTGVDAACPPDTLLPGETICRSSLGLCDVEELCTGASPSCPDDVVAPAGTACRAALGTCDLTEACTGVDPLCPADAFAPMSAPLCAPYRCPGSGSSCLTACVAQTDCARGNVCVAGACVLGYRMFVTSTRHVPTFGGASGADAICAGAAATAGLSGTFRAWISDSGSTAASRLHHSLSPYYRVDGTTPRIVANSWADLIDGISVAIATDEYGLPHRDEAVWTGTTDSGAGTGANCTNWTSSAMAVTATSGNASAAAFSTYYGARSCLGTQSLYCIEQPPPS